VDVRYGQDHARSLRVNHDSLPAKHITVQAKAIRVASSLKDGQSTVLSAPGAVGEAPATVEIRRDGDRLSVIDHSRQHRAEATLPDDRRAE
jgi:hypothetical protein